MNTDTIFDVQILYQIQIESERMRRSYECTSLDGNIVPNAQKPIHIHTQ